MNGQRRNRPEDAIQRAVFEHFAARAGRNVFAFAVPNGGLRSKAEAAIMKGLGGRAGVPDVVAVKEGQMYALELKAAGGRLRESQRQVIPEMEAAGAIVGVATGLDEALAWLELHNLLRGRAQG